MFNTTGYACLVLGTLFFFSPHVTYASNECPPATWDDGPSDGVADSSAEVGFPQSLVKAIDLGNSSGMLKTGDVNCRYPGATVETVNSSTCLELSDFYGISIDKFFTLNPSVKRDCSNLEPYTQYCVAGYIQPLVADDRRCGPPNRNATCLLTNFPCCNARTWTCGDTVADCEEGTCWDGACVGHITYSMDGKCGSKHGNLLCAGRWGDCCSFDGNCGSGSDFCGDGKCQSGNCTTPIAPPIAARPSIPPNDTPDGTCGGTNGYACNVIYGFCCSGDSRCGSLPQDCKISSGCQPEYGTCDNENVVEI